MCSRCFAMGALNNKCGALRLAAVALLVAVLAACPTPVSTERDGGSRRVVSAPKKSEDHLCSKSNELGVMQNGVMRCLCRTGTKCAGSACSEARHLHRSKLTVSGFNPHVCADCKCETVLEPQVQKLEYPVWIPKTVFADKVRLVFVAGMEGTGHQYWERMLHWARKDPALADYTRICSSSVHNALVRTKRLSSGERIFTGVFNAHTHRKNQTAPVPSLEEDLQSARAGLRNVLVEGQRLDLPSLFWLTADHNRTTGAMSYPNFEGVDRALQCPDVALLAKLAEETNLDLRVIVQLRDPVLSISSVERRFFKDPISRHRNIRIFIAAISQLVVQLMTIDPAFFVCLDMDATHDDNNLGRVLHHLHPYIREPFLKLPHKRHPPRTLREAEDEFAQRHKEMSMWLEEARAINAVLRSLCARAGKLD